MVLDGEKSELTLCSSSVNTSITTKPFTFNLYEEGGGLS
jgi:hypothetical protein